MWCTIYVLCVWAINVLYNLCSMCVGYKCVVQFMYYVWGYKCDVQFMYYVCGLKMYCTIYVLCVGL